MICNPFSGMFPNVRTFSRVAKPACLVLLTVWLPGCTTVKITEPARTATEQLLLSTAADRALRTADLGIFAGKRVYLDATYFDSYDSKYALGTIRDAISRAGAILAASPTNSDAIIEARSGALSTDSSDSLFGLPSIGIPIPLAGSVQTPEIAFYKAQRQYSTAKIVLLALDAPSGQHLYSSGPLVGKSYHNFYHLLGVTFYRTDLPEKQKNAVKAEEYQSWPADYTPQNFAVTNTPAAGHSTGNTTP